MGFVSVDVAGGSAQIATTAKLDLTSAAGRITVPDMNGGVATLGSLVSYAVGGAAQTPLPLSVPLLGMSAKTLTAKWDDLSNATGLVTNVSEFAALAEYRHIRPTTISFGLAQLEAVLANLATDDHATAVSYDAANREIRPFETSGQLTALLQGLPGLTNLVVTAAVVEDEIRFRLQFDKAVQRTYPLALGVAAQVDLPVTGNVAVNLATHVDLTFGVNQQNTFFVHETAGPQFAVSGTASADLDLATRLGFLGVTITNGTVSLPTAMLAGMPEQVQFLIDILGIVGSLPSDSNAGGYLDLTPYFGGTPRPGSTAG